jgi:excisionase family DNA binding protein
VPGPSTVVSTRVVRVKIARCAQHLGRRSAATGKPDRIPALLKDRRGKLPTVVSVAAEICTGNEPADQTDDMRMVRSSKLSEKTASRRMGTDARGQRVAKLRTINETAELSNISTRTVSRLADRFFTIAEIGQVLRVSTRTVRRWTSTGELVTHRFGRAVRISRIDLEIFVAKCRK